MLIYLQDWIPARRDFVAAVWAAVLLAVCPFMIASLFRLVLEIPAAAAWCLRVCRQAFGTARRLARLNVFPPVAYVSIADQAARISDDIAVITSRTTPSIAEGMTYSDGAVISSRTTVYGTA